MENYKEIQSVIDEYIQLMDKLIAFEQEKLDVISREDIELLNKYMKEEQVYLLQLRGLDQKREAAQEKCGVTGLTYKQIIEKMDGAEGNEMQEAYQILSSKTNEFRQIINTIRSHIEVKSHIIDHVIQKLGGKTDFTNNTYGTSGEPLHPSGIQTGRFQSTKV
ncbi:MULTISPECIES: flagellar export chaperone FlgN [Bacillati]|uniref:Flagellar export chaperone FlgN n=1 Tax=Clostridium aminobutyricum TaxID=33953 RepID=A0A939DAG9_CLOAM|nr:flagellar export chaperone FlgN [Clostridium aminobutyricum]MBN7773738.1 flagellar export chaperone FlgN [Clostridium aminobutyricum]